MRPPAMEKLVYLLWRDASEERGAFARRLVGAVGPKLVAQGALQVAVNAADADADLGRTVPIRDSAPEFAGVVTFWLGSVDERGAHERLLADSAARSAGSPPYAGIVEEHVRELADLTDPARFYGGAERMAANMRRILDDARSFLDLERVASVVTSEYILS